MFDDLFEFLQGAVTPYHAAAIAAAWLDAAGYTRLEEADYWNLEAGKGYYITRNGSSVIAWRVPEHAIGGWRIAASHSDSPCWKIKNEKVENDGCSRLSVEGYGGMIMSTWLDRPLTVAGRVMVKTEDGIESRLVNIDEDLLVIPSLAIHMQRNVNKGKEFNPQIDMQPLWGPAGCRTLTDVLCEELNVQPEDILDRDLQLVTRQQPTRIGPDGEYFLAPRIDDLECAATTLLAVDTTGALVGGAILPGPQCSLGALIRNTAQLPQVELEARPRKLLGANTADCLHSGIVYGTAAMLDGMVAQIRGMLGASEAPVVATGTLPDSVRAACTTEIHYRETLILEGLYVIWKKNARK